ncbi:MAG: pyridine nucleotide-disulfide oxidoreductase [Verrucomicrobiales bacterium VVV1]|nr:MAG: pyridine nucleotide-disulfide oxidoreductase [Verrucomicrobiales bacterium VVV1]
MSKPMRILILGGGFGGLYAALEFEKRNDPSIEVTLVAQENFFLFTPMLHEVAASDLDLTNIVSPLRKLLRRVRTFVGEVESIDLAKRQVFVSHGFTQHAHALDYDHLVLGLGAVTNFFNIPGLEERALCMKTLSHAVVLRNRLIAHLEEADTECAASDRQPLLTFVVAGGGFAGVETIGSINDFVHDALPHYPRLRRDMLRLILVHPGDHVLPELGESLGKYSSKQLAARGVEIHANCKVSGISECEVTLTNGTVIPSFTLVWTAGTSPCPLLDMLDLPKIRGRIAATSHLRVTGHPEVWALGDCALIPDENHPGQFHPPTAQHASRQGYRLASNLLAVIAGKETRPFRFRTLGLLASIGHRTGVARILGCNFSGFVAWWMWRTIYLSKLPGFEKKVRVALEWTLDLFFTKDFVQYQTEVPSKAISTAADDAACEVRAC